MKHVHLLILLISFAAFLVIVLACLLYKYRKIRREGDNKSNQISTSLNGQFKDKEVPETNNKGSKGDSNSDKNNKEEQKKELEEDIKRLEKVIRKLNEKISNLIIEDISLENYVRMERDIKGFKDDFAQLKENTEVSEKRINELQDLLKTDNNELKAVLKEDFDAFLEIVKSLTNVSSELKDLLYNESSELKKNLRSEFNDFYNSSIQLVKGLKKNLKEDANELNDIMECKFFELMEKLINTESKSIEKIEKHAHTIENDFKLEFIELSKNFLKEANIKKAELKQGYEALRNILISVVDEQCDKLKAKAVVTEEKLRNDLIHKLDELDNMLKELDEKYNREFKDLSGSLQVSIAQIARKVEERANDLKVEINNTAQNTFSSLKRDAKKINIEYQKKYEELFNKAVEQKKN